MLIVNQALNGKYYTFRGGVAAEFLAGLHLIGSRDVVVILPNGRKERGRFAVTEAKTALLVLGCEDVSNPVAQLAFDRAREEYMRRVTRNHDRTGS